MSDQTDGLIRPPALTEHAALMCVAADADQLDVLRKIVTGWPHRRNIGVHQAVSRADATYPVTRAAIEWANLAKLAERIQRHFGQDVIVFGHVVTWHAGMRTENPALTMQQLDEFDGEIASIHVTAWVVPGSES